MDPGSSGPPSSPGGDPLPNQDGPTPFARKSGVLGLGSSLKVARPLSSRPDPKRPARQSMVMSRPMPVIKLIAKLCFPKELISTSSISVSPEGATGNQEESDAHVYEFVKMRIPAYATVSLVKESVIKLEPKFFALEPRQLAISILCSTGPHPTSLTHEQNLGPSYERKLLIECDDALRYRYENDMPVLLAFWIASGPTPVLHLPLPSTSSDMPPFSPKDTSSAASSIEAPPLISVESPSKPKLAISSNPEPTSTISKISSNVSVIEIDGVLVHDDIGPLEDEEIEHEEEQIVQLARRTVLVESSQLEQLANQNETTPPTTKSEQKPIDSPKKFDPVIETVFKSQPALSGDEFEFLHTQGVVRAAAMRSSLQAATKMAMSSSRVTISDVLLEEQLWLKPDVLKEGWLLKKMKYSQKREPRWFQLRTDHHLYYYKDPNDTVPLGKIPLAITTVELPTGNQGKIDQFQLYYSLRSKERRVILSSEDQQTMWNWIDVINRTTRDAKETYAATIALEGYLLLKRGVGMKTWNRRYFVLKDGVLTYYLDAEAAKTTPDQFRRKISLEDCYVSSSSASISNSASSTASNVTSPTGTASQVSSGGSSPSLYAGGTHPTISVSSNTLISNNLIHGGQNIASTPTTSTSPPPISTSPPTATSNSSITNHYFRIHLSAETLHFMASSAAELQAWLAAINAERDSMKESAHLQDSFTTSTTIIPTYGLTTPDSIGNMSGLSVSASLPSITQLPSSNATLGANSVTSQLPTDFAPYYWNVLVHTKRKVVFVDRNLPIDEVISTHVGLSNIASHVDSPQLRLIRHHHARLRTKVIKQKARLEILDVLLAPLTRIPPSVPLPEVINVRYHFGESSVAAKCPIGSSILEGLAMALDLLVRRKIFPAQSMPSDFVVKLCGSRQYILDLDTLFYDIVYVREQLGRGKTFVELMLQTRAAVMDEISSERFALLVHQQNSSQTSTFSPSSSEHAAEVHSDDDLNDLLQELTDISKEKPKQDTSSPTASTNGDRSSTSLNGMMRLFEETCVDVADVRGHPFSIRVVALKNFSYTILEHVVPHDAVDNAKPESRISFFIQASIFHGNRVIGEPVRTAKRLTPFFNQILNFKVDCSQLAPEMRIGITLFVNHASKDLPLAWLNVSVSDYAGRVRSGFFDAGMWVQSKQAHPVGSCESDSARSLVLCLEFEKSPVPMVFADFKLLPQFFEITSLKSRKEPLQGPYKSEISAFRKAFPSKVAHPDLGENSLFGMGTFVKIQDDAKQSAIGSSRTRATGSAGSAGSNSSIGVSRGNSGLIGGARRPNATSQGSASPPSSTSSTMSSQVSQSPPGSTERGPSSSNPEIPKSNPTEIPPPSLTPLSDSTSPSSPSATPDALQRLMTAPSRSRKSYIASASPPVPVGSLFGQPASASSLTFTVTSSSSAESKPMSQFNAALQTSSGNPSPVPASSSSPKQETAPSSVTSPVSIKSPLSSTIWSKTVAKSNLESFAQQISPNLTTNRLIAHLQEIDRICKMDPLTPLTDTHKQLLWGYRKHLAEKPETFPKLFQAPNLLNPEHRKELHRIVSAAPLMPPEMALQLLDHKYPDSHVRAYAVRCLVSFGDEELASYLLQLVQVLQYEQLYLAPLASFLIERAILNPMLIGLGLLWHLQAELYRPETEVKFGLLMEAILLGFKPALRSEFLRQIDFVSKMTELNNQMQTVPPSNRTAFLRKTVSTIFNLPPSTLITPTNLPNLPTLAGTVGVAVGPSASSNSFISVPTPSTVPNQDDPLAAKGTVTTSMWSSGTIGGPNLPSLPPPSASRLVLPLSSSMVVKGLVVEKCRVMDSAAFPLWLSFENEDSFAEPISILFKFGDDLRQDALTLQMFTIMDRLWKKDGLDLKMSLYKCVPTGPNMGMIEVVPNAETTARIQKEAGGIIGAFKQTPLSNWLKNYNGDSVLWSDAIENFTRSCAAYCVATYVIGVGDRHNDNIMVTKTGKLFHIDFAHFLGNIIKFGVYKRERAPFVLTPEFAYVMGGDKSPGFAQFKTLCCHIYNILRRHSSTFISLFELMIFAGLTQLSSYDDLAYLKKSLLTTGVTENEASDTFSRLIDESLSTKSTQLNFAIHIFAHPD